MRGKCNLDIFFAIGLHVSGPVTICYTKRENLTNVG